MAHHKCCVPSCKKKHIYLIDHPEHLNNKFFDLESERLFEAGHLLHFHHFSKCSMFFFLQQMVVTKHKDVTKQGFCRILSRKLCLRRVSY